MGRKSVDKYFVPSGTIEERIEHMFLQLELPAMAISFKKILENIQRQSGAPSDVLSSLAEIEINDREEKRIARWEQQAKFPFKKRIANNEFEFDKQPGVKKSQINDFLSCRYIREGKNIVFLGSNGVGKTHLAIGLGLEAIKQGYKTRFLKLDDLLDMINKAEENETRLLRTLMGYKLLIIDEMHCKNNKSKNGGEFFYKMICERYNNSISTIFTSNESYSEWGQLFGTASRTGAALDRIISRSETIVINGPSYRLKDKAPVT